MKLFFAVSLLVGTSAFAPAIQQKPSTALFNLEKGAGGMFDTRNPDVVQHEDPRKSISEAPSFEEYLRMRDGGAAAAAPAPAAPAAPAPAWGAPAAPAPAWGAPASAPAPAASHAPEMGAGGMFDTRNPDVVQHEDPRKSISAAPSFEEYLRMRDGGAAAAPAAPAPVAPAPAAPAWGAPAAAAPAAPAWGAPAAAAPAAPAAAPASSAGGAYGKYDEQVWSIEAKQDVYNSWDPNAPRSPLNFNPFETWEGNSPDASGFYPGEGRYKDPIRPDTNFAAMQAERAILDEVAANPKAAPGCPGCRN